MRTSLTQLFLFVIFSVFVQKVNAQVWKKLPDQISTKAIYDAKELTNGNLLLCHSSDSVSQTSVALSEWTGTIWNTYPAYTYPFQTNYFIAKEIIEKGNSVYVLCEYNDSIRKYSVLRFNFVSKSWSTFNGDNFYFTKLGVEINGFEMFNDSIYVGGNIPGAFDPNVLLYLDVSSDSVIEVAPIQGTIYSLCAMNNYLLIGGNIFKVGSDSTLGNLIGLGGGFYRFPAAGGPAPAVKAIKRITPDSAFVMTDVGAKQIRFLRNDSLLEPIGLLPDTITLHGAAMYRSGVSAQNFPVVSIKLNSGNRILKVLPTVLTFETGINLQSDYKPVQSGNFVYAVPYISSAGTMPNSDIYVAKAASLVKGKVFADMAGNCALDSADAPLAGLVVGDTTEGIYTITDNNGNYELETDANSIMVTVQNREDFLAGSCGLPSLTPSVDSVYSLDIPLTPDNLKDISCQLFSYIGWRARQGFTENYSLEVKNRRIHTVAGKVVLTLPTGLSLNSSDITPSSSSGNVYEWNISSLAGFQKFRVNFSVITPLSIPVQTELNFVANTVFAADSVADNNTDTLVCTVVGAFDPNDKQCFPSGDLELHTEYIRYHIRFQNTGTDTAYRVTVIDTVDLNLPFIHFKMRGTSHSKYAVSVENNVIKWVFDDIQLPDSGRDMEGSQGFLEYQAKIKKGLKVGDSILNTAYIYFDYQKPVITNTVKSYYGKKVFIKEVTKSKGWLIYPNPTRSSFTIERGKPDSFEHHIHVINLLGKTMWSGTLNGLTGKEISTETWPSGCYFIETGNKEAIRLVVIR